MKQIFGYMTIAWIMALQVIGQRSDVLSIASSLGALCFFILKEKYLNRLYASVLYFIAAIVLAQYWDAFILLAAIPLLDFAYRRSYYLAVPALAAAIFFIVDAGRYHDIFIIMLALLVGHIIGVKDRNESHHLQILDDERRLRYDLEQARNELIRSRREIESLTEARERNRIAHALHDTIGHAIAGVLMQLEAALCVKDPQKTEEILKLCKGKLAETLELTRATAYNIRTAQKTGIDSLEKIIRGFTFCPVSFTHSGDFNGVSASDMEILESTVMEALTNASRYSHATAIEIRIDVRQRYIRLYYKDNGVGCQNIREGLGLAGMRERVRNAGGAISIDGSDGFLIVCNLPRQGAYQEGESL